MYEQRGHQAYKIWVGPQTGKPKVLPKQQPFHVYVSIFLATLRQLFDQGTLAKSSGSHSNLGHYLTNMLLN